MTEDLLANIRIRFKISAVLSSISILSQPVVKCEIVKRLNTSEAVHFFSSDSTWCMTD